MKNQSVSNAQRRKLRTRKKLRRTSSRDRLSVFRSNKHIYAQILEKETGTVLVEASDVKLDEKLTKTEKAAVVGETLAKLAVKKNITHVAFDRGSYAYHGRVKAVCEAARKHGLKI
jgi:large subunit ribosomal protein L18